MTIRYGAEKTRFPYQLTKARIQTRVHNTQHFTAFPERQRLCKHAPALHYTCNGCLAVCTVGLHKPNIRVAGATYQISFHHHRGERCTRRNLPSSPSRSVRQQLMEKDPYQIYWTGSLNRSVGDLKACHHQTHCQRIKHTNHPPYTKEAHKSPTKHQSLYLRRASGDNPQFLL